VGSEGKGEAASDAAGTFTLRFCRFGSDVAPTTPLPHNVTAAMVEEALEALSSLGDVEVELFNVDLPSATSTDDVNHAGDDDDGNDVSGGGSTLVVVPGASNSKSGVDLVAAGVVTFNPFTLTLTKDSPSANFTISASAGALSAPAKESVLVTSVLSGNLAATFTSLSAQDEILGERVEVLHRSSSSSSGAVEAEAALGFVLALAATAVMMPPPVLPSL
jgi:hypothetical protein